MVARCARSVKNCSVLPPRCLACCIARLAWRSRVTASRLLSGIRLTPMEALITSSSPATVTGLRTRVSRRLPRWARLDRLP
ncbi:hypothetical protein D3C77_546030 [compost metagenome]